jgi:hypothetical protein
MKIDLKTFCRFLYAATCVFFLFAFYRLALLGFISDSEIWVVNLAKHFREEWMHSWVFTRPLFYGILSVFVAPVDGAIAIFQSAKAFGICNATVIILFTFLLARRLSLRKWKWITPFIALLLLLTNAGFLNQGYRIRSDLLASSILLISIYLTVRIQPKHCLTQNLLWLSPLLATPKAILFILPFGFFKQEKKIKLLTLLTLALAATTTLILYPQLIGYVKMIFSSQADTGPYLSRASFFYLERLIEKNPLFFSIFILRFIFSYLRFHLDQTEQNLQSGMFRFFSLFTSGLVAILILSPDKNPFLIAAFLPIFAIFTSFIFEDSEVIISRAIRSAQQSRFKKLNYFGAIICCLSFSLSGWLAWGGFLENNNYKDLYHTIETLDSYLEKYPKASLYDVVGIIPKRSSIREFAGPNDPTTNKNTVDRLASFLPEIIFYVRKGILLEPDLSNLLRKHYRPLGSEVFGRWHYFRTWMKIEPKNKKIIADFVKQRFLAAGAKEDSSFYVMIKNKKNKIFIEKTTIEKLFSKSNINSGVRINGISIYSNLEVPIKSLTSTIGFDWDQ